MYKRNVGERSGGEGRVSTDLFKISAIKGEELRPGGNFFLMKKLAWQCVYMCVCVMNQTENLEGAAVMK